MCTSGNNKNNCYIVHGHKSTLLFYVWRWILFSHKQPSAVTHLKNSPPHTQCFIIFVIMWVICNWRCSFEGEEKNICTCVCVCGWVIVSPTFTKFYFCSKGKHLPWIWPLSTFDTDIKFLAYIRKCMWQHTLWICLHVVPFPHLWQR